MAAVVNTIVDATFPVTRSPAVTPKRDATPPRVGFLRPETPPQPTHGQALADALGMASATSQPTLSPPRTAVISPPVISPVPSPRIVNTVVPTKVAQKVGFYPIHETIKNFMNFSLYEIVKNNSKTQFLSNAKKYCYRLDYKNLAIGNAEARDNFADAIVHAYDNAYVKQHMHSISGEQGDLCYYGYSPSNMAEFLQINSHLHYTFLPLTVHAVDSANGTRHDMLLIFDNRTKLVYWFDGRNREDYLALGQNLPKNAMDVLFINLFGTIKLGYSYEPAPSWQIQGTLHSYGSIGTLDFILSTAWCYNALLSMEYYDSPTGYLSILDTLTEADRFHLLYTSMLSIIGAAQYHAVVPKTSQIDLTADTVRTADQDPNVHPASSVIPRESAPPQEIKASAVVLPGQVDAVPSVSHTGVIYHNPSDATFNKSVTRSSTRSDTAETQLDRVPYSPIPIRTSSEHARLENESCITM